MTDNFKMVVKLFSLGARGESFPPGDELDIDEIYRISVSQGVWETVYLALYEHYNVSKYEVDVIKSVANNISRREYIFSIIDILEQNGVECCFLKGITLARFYKNPEFRISGDTDILINKDKEKQARHILKINGFSVEENIGNMYHFEARHKLAGLLEVHIGLYQKHIDDLLFDNCLTFEQPRMEIEIEGHKCKTLAIYDGLNHLTAHYMKHFIGKGAGVRQLLDLLLYMNYYRNEIDWASYEQVWRKIGFYGLIEKLKAIGVIFFGIEFEIYDEKNIDYILTDVENGGLFGFDEKERINFIETFMQERNKHRIADFQSYMGINYKQKLIWRIFPNREYLIRGGYLYAKKGKIFLFVAYIHRFIKTIAKALFKNKGKDEAASMNVKNVHFKRLEMMKKMGLLSEKE